MRYPLPMQELKEILGDKGFLRFHGQDQFLYISDVPRRVTREALDQIQNAMRSQGCTVQISPSGLLEIDLQPFRWETLIGSFQAAQEPPFPNRDEWLDVYELARILARHPSPLDLQPMPMIRAVLKRYGRKAEMLALAPLLRRQCAEKLRCGAPLPSALANIFYAWLQEQTEEAHI